MPSTWYVSKAYFPFPARPFLQVSSQPLHRKVGQKQIHIDTKSCTWKAWYSFDCCYSSWPLLGVCASDVLSSTPVICLSLSYVCTLWYTDSSFLTLLNTSYPFPICSLQEMRSMLMMPKKKTWSMNYKSLGIVGKNILKTWIPVLLGMMQIWRIILHFWWLNIFLTTSLQAFKKVKPLQEWDILSGE